MRFNSLCPEVDTSDLTEEYKAARTIGSIRIGENNLFFKLRLKVYFVPYDLIRRCYRRVLLVPATVCCGKGELHVENLVLCTQEGEIAQIPLPGTREAKEVMRELQMRIHDCIFAAPLKKEKEMIHDA